jgi:hypothetical protein
MKSRKIMLIVFLAITSVIGLAAIQDNIFAENQLVDVNEFSSELNTITVRVTDGVGSGDNG